MKITQKHIKLLNVIIAYTEEKKYAPSMRELGEMMNFKSTSTVHGYLERLEKIGVIEWEPSKPRTLKVIRYAAYNR